MRPSKISRFTWVSLALVAAVAGGAAVAGPAAESSPGSEEAQPAATAAGGSTASPSEVTPVRGEAGLRVVLDPETGELRSRPTDEADDPERAAERPRLDEWLNSYSGDLIQEPLPQGGYLVDLQGRFQSAVVARIDPADGEVTIDCVDRPTAGEVADEE